MPPSTSERLKLFAKRTSAKIQFIDRVLEKDFSSFVSTKQVEEFSDIWERNISGIDGLPPETIDDLRLLAFVFLFAHSGVGGPLASSYSDLDATMRRKPASSVSNSQINLASYESQSTIIDDYALVIPMYVDSERTVDLMQKLLQTLLDQSMTPRTVIIIDDSSPVELTVTLPDGYNLVYERNAENKGAAYNRNLGIEIALSQDISWVILCDSDIAWSKGWFESFKEITEKSDAKMHTTHFTACGDTLFDYSSDVGGTINPWVFLDDPDKVYVTVTAVLAVHRDTCKEFKFDSRLKIGEDFDFVLRAQEAGHRVQYNAALTLPHDYGYAGDFEENLKRYYGRNAFYGEVGPIFHERHPGFFEYLREKCMPKSSFEAKNWPKIPTIPSEA